MNVKLRSRLAQKLDGEIAAVASMPARCAVLRVQRAILWLRRTGNPRVRAAGRKMDVFILSWLLATLLLGLSTIPVSLNHAAHGDAGVMIALAEWAQSVVSFRADPSLLANVDTIFKIHLFFGMTVFLLFPFTRLVHILSVPLGYLGRAYQIVRAKRPALTRV